MTHERKPLIYLAGPYSHENPAVKRGRFDALTRATARLIEHLGVWVFSPITNSHPLTLTHEVDGEWDTWRDYDLHMLALCDELWVLVLPGWETSVGVTAELKAAQAQGIRVQYISPLWGALELPPGVPTPMDAELRVYLHLRHPAATLTGKGKATVLPLPREAFNEKERNAEVRRQTSSPLDSGSDKTSRRPSRKSSAGRTHKGKRKVVSERSCRVACKGRKVRRHRNVKANKLGSHAKKVT